MSHFTVLCIRKEGNPRSIEEDLERYSENREVEPYICKPKEAVIDDAKAKAAGDCRRNKWILKITEDGLDKDEWIKGYMESERDSGVGLKEVEESWTYYNRWADLINKEKAGTATDEDYLAAGVADAIDNGERVDDDGNIISTYNPESRWDWYTEGGRWKGALKIQEASRKDYDGNEYADTALVGDIDWEQMLTITKEECEKAKNFWEYYVLDKPFPGTEEEKYAATGVEYYFYKREYYLEKYGTVDEYINSLCRWTTYAVMDDDGEWYEAGKMGWFGTSSATDDDEMAWGKQYYDRFIDGLRKNDKLTIIDCHI